MKYNYVDYEAPLSDEMKDVEIAYNTYCENEGDMKLYDKLKEAVYSLSLMIKMARSCGSYLHALFSEDKKKFLFQDKSEMKNVAFNIKSAYSMNGKRIFYSEIFKNPTNDLINAMIRVVPKINMNTINCIIDETPSITEVDKSFFKESIQIRKNLILDKAYNELMKNRIAQGTL